MTPDHQLPGDAMATPPADASATTLQGRGTLAALMASILFPLALTQFIASYAASSMNVAISDIASDIGTTTRGVQTAITLFTLTMAALMIPGSKLTDILGRKRTFMLGLVVYGAGALLATLAQGIGTLVIGYSLLEGIGSALMIPPIYILLTILFSDIESRAKAFGIVSAAAGLGAASGPLIGGLLTSAISWRAAFLAQVLVVAGVIFMGRRLTDDKGTKSNLDIWGSVLSAVGLVFVVLGILTTGTYGWLTATKDVKIGDTVIIGEGGVAPVWFLLAAGAFVLAWFFLHVRSMERAGKEPLLSSRLFRNRTSNLGLVTQNVQWLTMQGSFFVISVYLQTVSGYSAIKTGLILSASTAGILASSAIAGRMARRRPQVQLIRAGFVLMVAGLAVLLALAQQSSNIVAFLPGLFLMGFGIGVMLTASVNVVQSSFPEQDQGEISGLSRSVSNLGSSLGTSLVGSVLVSQAGADNGNYRTALILMGIIALLGLGAALLIPREAIPAQGEAA